MSSQAATGEPGLEASAREPGRRLEDGVAVAHPALLGLGQAGEQPPALLDERQLGAAELAPLGALDPAAERPDHDLHPVTDAEHRDAELEQLGAQRRRARLVDGGRPAGEDQRARLAQPDPLDVGVVGQQLGEDPALAEPARDQLRVLAAEVEHEDLLAIDPDRARLAARRIDDGGVDRAFRRAAPPPCRQSSETATPLATADLPFEPIPTDWLRCSCLPSVCSAGATMTSARWNEGMSS